MLELATHRSPGLKSLATLFEALHEKGIRYCHLKGNPQHLRVSLSGESDIDVLFDEKQKDTLETILATFGFKKFVAIKSKQLKDVVDFLTLDETSGKVIHLHSYFALTMGEPYLKGYQVSIASHLLGNRVFNEEFGTYCIPPAYELVLMYLTESLKLTRRHFIRIHVRNKIYVSEKEFNQDQWLRRNTTPAEIEEALKAIFDNYLRIDDIVTSGLSSRQLQKLAPSIKKAAARYRVYSPLLSLLLRWKREISARFRRNLSRIVPWPVLSLRFNPRGGIVVAFTGTYYYEKSTVTDLLQLTFGKKLDVYTVTFDGTSADTHSVANILPRAWQRNLKMRNVQTARKYGALVLCDRCSGIKRYSPNIVFHFIKASASIRNAADTINEYSDKHSKNKCRVVTIDANKPLSEVMFVLKKKIWEIL